MNQDRQLLSHELLGSGDDVVMLLNGGMMSYQAWGPITEALCGEGYRVLGFDFLGQMRSPGDAHPQLEEHAADVIQLLDSLELDHVHILGTSFGGEVGVLLAAQYPSRVRSLTAVAAVDRTPPGMAENCREMLDLIRDILDGGDRGRFHDKLAADIYSQTWRRAHAGDLAARRAQFEALPLSFFRGVRGILKSVEDFDLTSRLGAITCPTLVIHAADDTVMPAERVQALAETIHGAELQIHPTASHVLVLEDPAWLIHHYVDFLDRQSTSTAAAESATETADETATEG